MLFRSPRNIFIACSSLDLRKLLAKLTLSDIEMAQSNVAEGARLVVMSFVEVPVSPTHRFGSPGYDCRSKPSGDHVDVLGERLQNPSVDGRFNRLVVVDS